MQFVGWQGQSSQRCGWALGMPESTLLERPVRKQAVGAGHQAHLQTLEDKIRFE